MNLEKTRDFLPIPPLNVPLTYYVTKQLNVTPLLVSVDSWKKPDEQGLQDQDALKQCGAAAVPVISGPVSGTGCMAKRT